MRPTKTGKLIIGEGECVAAFTTAEAPGAWRNGTRVVKVAFETGDTHALGDLATIVGSLGPIDYDGSRYGYFVFWDAHPQVPVFVADKKLAIYAPTRTGGGDA